MVSILDYHQSEVVHDSRGVIDPQSQHSVGDLKSMTRYQTISQRLIVIDDRASRLMVISAVLSVNGKSVAWRRQAHRRHGAEISVSGGEINFNLVYVALSVRE